MAAFAAVACAASPAAASGAVAGGHAAPRFRALVHVEDMDAELVLDERDEAGDGDWHSLGDERTRHAEARAAYEDALADIEERLYGSALLTKTASGSRDEQSEQSERDVESAFRELFSFVADAPSPERARDELARAAARRASRLGENNAAENAANEQTVASLEDLPADWRAVADALYLLASLVELGVAPRTRDAYPEPRIELANRMGELRPNREGEMKREERLFETDPDGRWSDVHFADADPSAPVLVPTHPALASPKAWAAAAVFAAAEMGSREARLAAGDRVLRGRGFRFAKTFVPEDDDDETEASLTRIDAACERATRVYLFPVAERIADAAEADGDVRVPSEPPRLRDRERDAGYVDDADAEDDGDAQIEMERDMAARGVPEAERHLGYRALVGRGVRRDEQDALRRFGNAANLGDPLAMFNLGYMHMRGVGTEVNHTEARRLFEKAASLDVAAAHNGVGVLDYNGWATADGAPNVVAARARFEAGAAAGDPDASFNLGTLYQTGAGGLPVDHSLAYARYQAASDAGHWRAPLAVAKLTLEGWHPPSRDGLSDASDASSDARAPETRSERDEESVIDESGEGVERNCREAARLVMAFVEERLIVFADEHEAALAALEGGFVDDASVSAAELKAHAKETISETENDGMYFDETEVGPDPWSALVRYALIAERGGEAGLANAAFLAKKAGAAKSKSTFFNANGAPLPRHVTRRAARDAAREALTRLAAMGDVEARVDLGDIEWAAAVEGDEEETEETEVAFDRARSRGPEAETLWNSATPRPPAEPAPDSALVAFATPPPPVPPPRASSSTPSESESRGDETWSLGAFSSPLAVSAHGTLDPPRPPAPASPPRGFTRMRRVAFHYEEASLLGLPEGSVSLAWCWSRGVGVPRRDLKRAELALWKAHDDSMDEMESFAPLAAAAAISALRAATALFSFFAAAGDAVESVDLVKFLDLAFGAKESNAVLYPGSVPGTSPGTTSGDKTRHGRRARENQNRRETTRDAEAENGFFLRVERCVLATAVCGFAAIGYARFIALVGEHREARAAFLDRLSPATVAGVTGAVAAAAWVAVA